MRPAMHFRIDAPNGAGYAPCPQNGAVKRLTYDPKLVTCRACMKTGAYKAAAQEAPELPELPALGDALRAAYPPVKPAPVTVRDAVIAIRDWAVSTRPHAIHYGIEALIKGADAVLLTDSQRPHVLEMRAELSEFLPEPSAPAPERFRCVKCGAGSFAAVIDYGDLGAGNGGPCQYVFRIPSAPKLPPYDGIGVDCLACGQFQYAKPAIVALPEPEPEIETRAEHRLFREGRNAAENAR